MLTARDEKRAVEAVLNETRHLNDTLNFQLASLAVDDGIEGMDSQLGSGSETSDDE